MDRKKPIDGHFSPIESPSRARWVRDGRMSRVDDWSMGLAPRQGGPVQALEESLLFLAVSCVHPTCV